MGECKAYWCSIIHFFWFSLLLYLHLTYADDTAMQILLESSISVFSMNVCPKSRWCNNCVAPFAHIQLR